MSVIEDRLATLATIHLQSGEHADFEAGVCAMEAAAWIAGEPHSDHPECVSPIITAFMVSWNDSLRSDEERDRLLKPLIPFTIGTRTSKRDETTRAWMCVDWLAREQAPAWLRLAGLTEHAVLLEGLAPLKGAASARKAQTTLNEARSASGAASDAASAAARGLSWEAAWGTSWEATWEAARGAAWGAARGAASAAARGLSWEAAWSISWDAAWGISWEATWEAAREATTWEATWDAARDAARDALAPTVELLQTSAGLLVTRMCEVNR